MCNEISKKQKSKCSIKGKVKTWKNCDDIWIFYADNVALRTDSESFHSEKLKVVAVDVNMKKLYEDGKEAKKENNDD